MHHHLTSLTDADVRFEHEHEHRAHRIQLLPVTPVYQQTLSWCWLASAEIIFVCRLPPVNGISYQCGIMGAVTGPGSVCFYNCALCAFGSGSDANSARVLIQYPQIVQQLVPVRVPQVTANLYERRLSMSEVQQEIDGGRPIELGITPEGPFQGQAGHDVVIVGDCSQRQHVPGND